MDRRSRSVDEKGSIVDIIKYQEPRPVPLIAQPVIHKAKDIRSGVLPSRELENFSNLAVALSKAVGVAGMNPKYPRLGDVIANSIAELDRQLRLAMTRSAFSHREKG